MADTYIDPSPAQIEAVAASATGGPLDMMNLMRFRPHALYPGSSDADITGARAYGRYAAATAPLLAEAGGYVIWSGTGGQCLIGPASESWDMALLVRYPDAAAFLGMIQSPAYRAIVVHRQAAVLTSRLIQWSGASDLTR